MMWSRGISNPLSVIEQLTYLLFIKRLDELHTLKERKAARTDRRSSQAGGEPHPRRPPAACFHARSSMPFAQLA